MQNRTNLDWKFFPILPSQANISGRMVFDSQAFRIILDYLGLVPLSSLGFAVAFSLETQKRPPASAAGQLSDPNPTPLRTNRLIAYSLMRSARRPQQCGTNSQESCVHTSTPQPHKYTSAQGYERMQCLFSNAAMQASSSNPPYQTDYTKQSSLKFDSIPDQLQQCCHDLLQQMRSFSLVLQW